MLSYCTNYLATMPDITVYMNCDTRLAINLQLFELGDNDEFIFAIKNYSYINSPYVFLFKARKSDMDENGEVIFKITPKASQYLRQGAFYNFAVMINAYDPKQPTEYRKLTDNGAVRIEYGAQDLTVEPDFGNVHYEITNVRMELLDATPAPRPDPLPGDKIIGMRLEPIPED